MTYRFRRAVHALAVAAIGVTFASAAEAVPPRASDPVPDPGRGITNSDDTTAIALNPANLAFLPGPEFRFNTVWTGSGSPLPNRGTSFALGAPIGPIATGLRLDLLFPRAARRRRSIRATTGSAGPSPSAAKS
ncbi:Hypothetical protein A7982_09348 [Minicystis rosea]|nr:Hypothetical protein A7982_09348 [Minicystis rosea]